MALSGLKKIKKKNPIQNVVTQNMPDLQGGINIFGRIGSGKTVSMLAIAQLYHDHPSMGYKIIDGWGGDRNEHLYWGLPSNKIEYWKWAERALKLDKPGPKQYKVKYLYPVWSKLPKKLPHNPPHVISQVFTIPFRDIKIEDLALITGTLSARDESVWNDVIYESSSKTTPSDVIELMKKKKSESWTVYRNSIKPLVRELILQGDNCALNVDMKAEIKDKKTITVLCLDFVPKEFRYFVMGYIVRKITEELDRKRTKTICLIREASEIFRVENADIIPARIKVLKSYMSQWIRMGRRGLHFMLDTQSPAETRGLVGGQQDLSFFGRLPSRADRESATEQLRMDNLITSKQVTQIATLEPGQFIVCPSGKKAYFQYFFLPKTRFWEEGNGNFYKGIWANFVNTWSDTIEIIKELKELKKQNDKSIQDKIKIQKALKKSIRPISSGDKLDLGDDIDEEDLDDERIEEEVKIKKEKEDKISTIVKKVSKAKPNIPIAVQPNESWEDLI